MLGKVIAYSSSQARCYGNSHAILDHTDQLGQLSLASPLGSLNRVPDLIGWGKGGNVASAGWQVTLCDPIWHVSSRIGETGCELPYPITYLLTYLQSYTSHTAEVTFTPLPQTINTCTRDSAHRMDARMS